MINPIIQFAHDVCYARGMADVCKCILETGLENFQIDKVMSDYQPKVKDGLVPAYIIEEEARHGYIQGKYECWNIINNMSKNNGRSNEEVLNEIAAFCKAIVDIVKA